MFQREEREWKSEGEGDVGIVFFLRARLFGRSVPDYSHYVTFELFDRHPEKGSVGGEEEIPAGRFYVRILYNDQPLHTPACGSVSAEGERGEGEGVGTCDVLDFIAFVERETLKDWEGECARVLASGRVRGKEGLGNGRASLSVALTIFHRDWREVKGEVWVSTWPWVFDLFRKIS